MSKLVWVVLGVAACGATEVQGSEAGAGDAAAEIVTGPCQPTFCSEHGGATFCSDFDEDSPMSAWSSTSVSQTTGAETLSLMTQSSDSVSCPASLIAAATNVDTFADNPHAWAEEIDDAGGSDATLDLDIELPAAASGSFNVFVLTSADRTTPVSLQYVEFYQKGFIWLLVGGGGGSQQVAPVVGRWTHMTLAVHFGNSDGTVALTYDDVVAGNTTVSLQGSTLPYGVVSASPVVLDVGMQIIPQTQFSGTASVAYDNVVLVVK